MYIWAIAIFFGLQLLLLALDVRESRRERRRVGQPLPKRTLVFLSAVTLVFLVIQLSGGWLFPTPLEILESVRHRVSVYSNSLTNPKMSNAHAVLLGIVLFYTAGFWDYIVHRSFSHSRWFWFTHEYHHLPNRVSVLMPGILVRPFNFIPATISTLATAVTVYVLLFLIGLPIWDLRPLLPIVLVIGLVLTASHSMFLRRWPVVHRLMRCAALTSPQEHLLHHAVGSASNFGNFTTLWDRIFGTYENPDDFNLDTVVLGLSYDQDFLGTLTMGQFRLSPNLRQKYQVARYCNLDNR